MHIISKKRLREFWTEHADANTPLLYWYNIARRVAWSSLADVRRDFPHADPVGICTVFNIKGNDYRLITKIEYVLQKLYIKHVLTHADYDKGRWKDGCAGP